MQVSVGVGEREVLTGEGFDEWRVDGLPVGAELLERGAGLAVGDEEHGVGRGLGWGWNKGSLMERGADGGVEMLGLAGFVYLFLWASVYGSWVGAGDVHIFGEKQLTGFGGQGRALGMPTVYT